MSRIGKKPVTITNGVTVKVDRSQINVSGPKGTLSFRHRPEVAVTVNEQDREVLVERKGDFRVAKAMHGLTRSLIANMIEGVSSGYTRELEVVGVGWNAKVQGQKVVLNVGYADPREVAIPSGITVAVEQNRIKVSGADKQLVGQVASQIRAHRKPEPYNGKGIRYSDEVVVRKEGKGFAG